MLEMDRIVVPLDCLGPKDQTALYTASSRGHVNVVQYLLKAGANGGWRTKNWNTALHSACEEPSSVAVVRLLLSAGCDVNAADRYGGTALVYACADDDNEEILHMLIDAGADLINEGRRRLLHECVERSAMNNLGILLNRYSVDLYLKNSYGQTALHEAVRRKQLDDMRIMLQCDDDRRLKDDGIILRQQQQPDDDVSSAAVAVHRSLDVLDHQRTPSYVNICPPQQQSRLIDCQDSRGQTVLYFAVIFRSLELLSELLNWKPNLKIESTDTDTYRRYTALDKAVCQTKGKNKTGRKLDIVRCLIEHPNGYGQDIFMWYRVRALCLAIEQESYNLTLIEYLLNIADLRIPQNVDGNTALHLAAQQCRAGNIMSVLLRHPYAAETVNIRSAHNGRTVLHDAIIHGQNSDTVRAIAEMANVNLPDHNGKTPLHYAVTASNPSNVRILLDFKADVCIRDHDGNTAFVLACCCAVVTQTKKTQLSNIYELYRHGIAYGELSNMV